MTELKKEQREGAGGEQGKNGGTMKMKEEQTEEAGTDARGRNTASEGGTEGREENTVDFQALETAFFQNQ